MNAEIVSLVSTIPNESVFDIRVLVDGVRMDMIATIPPWAANGATNVSVHSPRKTVLLVRMYGIVLMVATLIIVMEVSISLVVLPSKNRITASLTLPTPSKSMKLSVER